MPEPLSIATAAVGVVKLTWNVGESLHHLIKAVPNIGEDVRELHAECDALRSNADGLSKTLDRPELANFHDPELWDKALVVIDNAAGPMRSLETALEGLKVSHRKGWKVTDIIRGSSGILESALFKSRDGDYIPMLQLYKAYSNRSNYWS